ncbi:hypothetical protein IE53DRAFT_118884 [Violaceomyces palustris]|uniref:Uncharacterized protein n=1 Tax=Violaceomyces palustris TaxID=1673888 RepID=A0ACD0NVV6_9BASI|nr:hypothetical protein IE53DRAFT_118884 [Violaceomyces palustris]
MSLCTHTVSLLATPSSHGKQSATDGNSSALPRSLAHWPLALLDLGSPPPLFPFAGSKSPPYGLPFRPPLSPLRIEQAAEANQGSQDQTWAFGCVPMTHYYLTTYDPTPPSPEEPSHSPPYILHPTPSSIQKDPVFLYHFYCIPLLQPTKG